MLRFFISEPYIHLYSCMFWSSICDRWPFYSVQLPRWCGTAQTTDLFVLLSVYTPSDIKYSNEEKREAGCGSLRLCPAFTDAPKQNQWRWFGSVKYLVLRKFILSYYLYDYNLQHCLSSFAHFIHQSEYSNFLLQKCEKRRFCCDFPPTSLDLHSCPHACPAKPSRTSFFPIFLIEYYISSFGSLLTSQCSFLCSIVFSSNYFLKYSFLKECFSIFFL